MPCARGPWEQINSMTFLFLCHLDQDPTLCSHKTSAPSGHSHIEFACGPLGHQHSRRSLTYQGVKRHEPSYEGDVSLTYFLCSHDILS